MLLVLALCVCVSPANEMNNAVERVLTEEPVRVYLRSVTEEHTCFSALLWYWGLGKLCFGKRQWNFIRHFPELSTCSFLEYSPFSSGEVPCFEEHRRQSPGCFDDLLARERRYCLSGKTQSEKERLRIV